MPWYVQALFVLATAAALSTLVPALASPGTVGRQRIVQSSAGQILSVLLALTAVEATGLIMAFGMDFVIGLTLLLAGLILSVAIMPSLLERKRRIEQGLRR